MVQANASEQLLLELINRARLDPKGEFARLVTDTSPATGANADITAALRFFDVDLALLHRQINHLTPAAPVAWNGDLGDSADKHSRKMIAFDSQEHVLPGEADLGPRIRAEGYHYTSVGENIFAFTNNPLFGHAGFFIDWGFGPGGLQTPAGHRTNIMRAEFVEVGVGVVADHSSATRVGPLVVTQDFGARSGYHARIVGVVYKDKDHDDFYSVGEGQGQVRIAVSGGHATRSGSAGGYQVEADSGARTATFSGGPLTESVAVKVQMGAANVKVDLVGGHTVLSSTTAQLGAHAHDLVLLGTKGIDGTGNARGNTIVGNSASNDLTGGGGDDHFVFKNPGRPDNITDFRVHHDLIALDHGAFRGLAAGDLEAAQFHIGSHAHDATDRVIYNANTGQLMFDRDGHGGKAATVFAELDDHLRLSHHDFEII